MDVTPIEKEEFMLSALQIAKEQSFIWGGVTDAHDEHLSRLYVKWGGDAELKKFKDVSAALVDFRQRLIAGKSKLEVKFADRTREIDITAMTCKIEIPLGNGRNVEFGAAGNAPVDATPDERKYYYGQLFQVCWQGIMEFRQNTPMQLKPQYQQEGDTATEQFEFHTIEVEIAKGKRQFNVVGDKFPKHGIPVYHEVLARAGIASEKLVEGNNSVSGLASFVKNTKGQAHKVVHIQVGA